MEREKKERARPKSLAQYAANEIAKRWHSTAIAISTVKEQIVTVATIIK